MKLVVIGTGNVAHVLGRAVVAAQHEVLQVVGRNKQKAHTLAEALNAQATAELRKLNEDADIYIIAVSDKALPEVAKQIKLQEQIVVHTAASVSKDVLSSCSRNFGILYPIQTLQKEASFIPDIPVLVDGNNDDTNQVLQQFAQTWASNVKVAKDEERLKLHVAAVVACNFTNHLYALAKDYCDKELVDFNLLQPMIEETAKRLSTGNPAALQTGPAVRNDTSTIQKHLQLLQQHPELKELYEVLTKSIFNLNRAGEL